MHPHRSPNQDTGHQPSQLETDPSISKRRGRLSFRLLLLAMMLSGLVVVSWQQLVVAPELTESTNDSDIVSEVQAEPELSESEQLLLMEAEKQQALEAERQQALEAEKQLLLELEREREELLALESSYYLGSTVETVLASDWSVSPQRVLQGEVLLVRHAEEQEVSLGGHTFSLQPFGTGFYAFIPIPVNLSPGEYDIGDQTIVVEQHQFETQYLDVTEQLESMRRDTERIAEDQLKVNEARSHSEPTFLFSPDNPFIMPLEGNYRLTTPYGYTRYVNGALSGRHMAIDLAMPQGTPVMATNDGIVVLSDELYLAGNSVYIDHGMGLFSQYSHLYEWHVEIGDEVKQGDIIGLVGSTGFSTGPHLHFTFWVHNVPVNPDLFFEQTPFHWFE